MHLFKKVVLIIVVLLISEFGIAQNQTTSSGLPCGIDDIHEILLKNDPLYKKNVNEFENLIRLFIRDSIIDKQNNQNNLQQRALVVYTIPVVVHVIHLGESVGSVTNISDAQVQAAISGLNDRFRNIIGTSIDVEIQFCLATRDPNGNSTTGINRVNGSGVANYSSYGIDGLGCGVGASETAIKNLSRWPNFDYYNIWIVKSICNGAWGGYAYYPGASSTVDGAVIRYGSFNYNNPLTAHEVGHGFNLRHTFEGDSNGSNCPSDTNCATQGDFCCDTPPHKRNDCGSSNPCTASGIWNNSRYNYMSYCGLSNSTGRFTQDQTNRMRATLTVSPRSHLLNSLGCSAPGGFSFNSPAAEISVCPAPASMAITLGTNSIGGFSNPITLSAIAGVPAGTNVTFGTNPVTPGNNSIVTLNNTNILAPGNYVITVQGVASGAPNQSRNLTYTITAGSGPAITVQPANQSACSGAGISFSITSPSATGFQWQLSTNGGTIYLNIINGGIYSGATTAVLMISSVSAGMNNYRYRCIVSGLCGSATSDPGILTINPIVIAYNVSGSSPLCIMATAIYTSSGTSGGSWSSTDMSVATVNSSTGLVTAESAGTTNITYTLNSGCGSPVSAFKTLTVNPNVSPGIVSGTSPLCVNASTVYTKNGASGGTWSSTVPAVASVNASNGFVTALAAGITDITYTVTSGCGSPASAFKTLTVNPLPVVNCPGNISVSIDVPPFALSGGSPSGGTYSGTGVSAGIFYPAIAGAGVKNITYNYSDPGTNCNKSCMFTISVIPLPPEFIHGSVKKNVDPAKIDIVFRPTSSNSSGEYIFFLMFSLAIPVDVSSGVNATAVGVNTFSNMGTLESLPPYTEGSEQVFTWYFSNQQFASQSWTSGVDFTGIEVTFSTTAAAEVGKMVDFTNNFGGGNSSTYFFITSNLQDKTDYGNLFYPLPGQSILGNYPNADQLVISTSPLINDDAWGAIQLTIDGGCSGSPYTNVGATQNGSEPFASCVGTAGYKTVWYKFTAPASGAVRISTDYPAGTMDSDSRLSLFSATDVFNYATFSNIACDDNNGNTIADRSVLYATGLTSGATYYIQVDGKTAGTTTGTFCLTVDELTSTMISTSTACAAGQNLGPVNDNYIGWLSATDANGQLVALINNPSGGATTSTYSSSLNINAGAIRSDAVSGQKYLDRNFSINNASVSNVNVRFFLLNTELAALQAADPVVALSNLQITRQTGVSCDNNFVAANGMNSSLGQTGNGSGSGYSWVQVITPGFSKFFLHTGKSFLPVKVFLHGAYSTSLLRHKNITSNWASVLNANALNQPYSGVPFNYSGTETVSPGFFTSGTTGSEILDWVLLELRSGTTPSTVISRRAAFVRSDGRVVDLDGVSDVAFDNVPTDNYHLVIRHRNHLAIRTSATTTLDASLGASAPAVYDFTNSQSKAYQNPAITNNAAMRDLGGGVFGMWGGNGNSDGQVRATGLASINDFLFLLNALSNNPANIFSNVYNRADLNMDGTIRASGLASINDYLFLMTAIDFNPGFIVVQHQ